MEKAIRFLILGAILGVCIAWLSTDLSVRAEASDPVTQQQRGVYTQTIDKEIPCGEAPDVVLKNHNGAVTVSSWDRDAVGVTAVKHYRASRGFWGLFRSDADSESAQAALDAMEVEIETGAGSVAIETKVPKGLTRSNRWIDYELRVPVGAHLDLHTSNGRIDVIGVDGTIVAESSNGQINTRATRGDIRAETSNGAIFCQDASGGLDLETSNGRIHVVYSGTVDDAIECTTSNGRIEVALPADASFRLDAGTRNGRIQSEFPMPVTAGATTQLAGEVGAGGPTVRLRTSNGGIHLIRQ